MSAPVARGQLNVLANVRPEQMTGVGVPQVAEQVFRGEANQAAGAFGAGNRMGFSENLNVRDFIQQAQEKQDSSIKQLMHPDRYRKPILPKTFKIGKARNYQETNAGMNEISNSQGTVLVRIANIPSSLAQAVDSYVKAAVSYNAIRHEVDTLVNVDNIVDIQNVSADDKDLAKNIFGTTTNAVAQDARQQNLDWNAFLGSSKALILHQVFKEMRNQNFYSGQHLRSLNRVPSDYRTGYVLTDMKKAQDGSYYLDQPFVLRLYNISPTRLIGENSAYKSAAKFYKSRAYKTHIQKIKVQFSPVQIKRDQLFYLTTQSATPYYCQTGLCVKYDAEEREKLNKQLLDLGQDTTRTGVLKDRIISLEPEMRSLARFANTLESYEIASSRYAMYHKAGKDFSKVLKQDTYDKVTQMLNQELALLDSANGNFNTHNTFEWPTARVTTVSLVTRMMIWVLQPAWALALTGNTYDNSKGQADRLFNLDYSLSIKQVTQKTVNTPLIDRIQFTKSLKYQTYLALRVGQENSYKELELDHTYRVTKNSIGLILKKRRRLQLQAILDQSELTLTLFQTPVVQMALRFFTVFDATSLNIRRIITFATYKHMVSPNVESMSMPLLPLKYTARTRYDALRASQETQFSDALENWHTGYKLLAESHIRRRLQKSSRKVFNMMRTNAKTIASMAGKVDNLNAGRAGFDYTKFIIQGDPHMSAVAMFGLTIAVTIHPPYIDTKHKLRGFTGTNILAAKAFSEMMTLLLQSSGTDSVDKILKAMVTAVTSQDMMGSVYNPGYAQTNASMNLLPNMLILENGVIRTNVEDLKKYDIFLRYFFPGVTTLYWNKSKDNKSIDNVITEQLKQVGEEQIVIHRIMWIRAVSVCFELMENGILFTQLYNTAYFKKISDASMLGFCLFWWHYTKWTISHIQGLVRTMFTPAFSQNQAAMSLIEQVFVSMLAVSEEIQSNYFRALRRDKITQRTDKKKTVVDLFPKFIAAFNLARPNVSQIRVGATGGRLAAQMELARRGEAYNMAFFAGVNTADEYVAKLEEARQLTNINNATRNTLKKPVMTGDQKNKLQLAYGAGGLFDHQAFDGGRFDQQDPTRDDRNKYVSVQQNANPSGSFAQPLVASNQINSGQGQQQQQLPAEALLNTSIHNFSDAQLQRQQNEVMREDNN